MDRPDKLARRETAAGVFGGSAGPVPRPRRPRAPRKPAVPPVAVQPPPVAQALPPAPAPVSPPAFWAELDVRRDPGPPLDDDFERAVLWRPEPDGPMSWLDEDDSVPGVPAVAAARVPAAAATVPAVPAPAPEPEPEAVWPPWPPRPPKILRPQQPAHL